MSLTSTQESYPTKCHLACPVAIDTRQKAAFEAGGRAVAGVEAAFADHGSGSASCSFSVLPVSVSTSMILTR